MGLSGVTTNPYKWICHKFITGRGPPCTSKNSWIDFDGNSWFYPRATRVVNVGFYLGSIFYLHNNRGSHIAVNSVGPTLQSILLGCPRKLGSMIRINGLFQYL